MNMQHFRDKGFSLIELTVVLLLITLIASVAVRETSELAFQARYEQTKERLEMIKQAILGNPRQIINGQQAISGFVADMGRLPTNLRELVQRSGDCSDDAGDVSEAECLGLTTPGVWTASAWSSDSVSKVDPSTGLRYGWNGPYLNISGNPADNDAFTDGWGRLSQGYCNPPTVNPESIMDSASCPDAGAADWTPEANDFNYGWYFNQLSAGDLTILSYGKDQIFGGIPPSYDTDYPDPVSQPAVRGEDWLVDIRSGLSVVFKKSFGQQPPISSCSDQTQNTRSSCTAASAVWRGGCDSAGLYNKDSCPPLAWRNCEDNTSISRATCEAAGKEWYGEGFGCSLQEFSTKQTCSATWRSCTDNGTSTTESTCLAAGEIWYGDSIFTSPSMMQKICLKVFYRKPTSQIGTLISDENIGNDAAAVSFDPKTITADGSLQTIRFNYFRDSASAAGVDPVTSVSMGSLAIGIYKFNGTSCATSTTLFPADRQFPIQVDFHSHTTLPVINW